MSRAKTPPVAPAELSAIADRVEALDRRNISIATYQMGSEVAQLASDLARFETAHSPVWADSARHRLTSLKAAIAEIEAVLNPTPKRNARITRGGL